MLASPCYIISDTHLGAGSRDEEAEFGRFLKSLPGRARSLVINGDLFDFWFEWQSVIPRHHYRTLSALADLRESGTDILMIAGNHDCWGGDVLTHEIGVAYQVGPWEGEIAGWRSLLEHGDGLRAVEDRTYRMLRTVLRHPVSVRAFRWMHPDWGTKLARWSSGASRAHRAADEGAGLRTVALERVAARPDIELIVYGHSHIATLERAQGGGVYANAGSWLEAPTYLVVTPDAVELRRWKGSAESERLHSLDRRSQKVLPQP